MEELHRRIAPPVRVPAVAWHLGIWPDVELRDRENPDEQDRLRNEWLSRVEGFLKRIEAALTGEPVSETFRLLTDPPWPANRQIWKSPHREIHGDHFTWSIKAEVHFEFVTITLALSLGPPSTSLTKPIRQRYEWPAFFGELSLDVLERAFARLSKPEAMRTESLLQERLVPAERLHEDLWHCLAHAVCENTPLEEAVPGWVFADFRGLVLDVHQPELDKELDRFEGLTDRAGSGTAPDVIGRFINSVDAINRGHDDREFVACWMLGHRFIYVTTLGAKPSEWHATTTPVRFTLFAVRETDRYQTGRLIERINALGVARIAALKDLERIRAAGRRVQALGIELDRLMRTVAEQHDSGEPLAEAVEFKRKLTILFGSGKDGKEASFQPDGLTFRIARAEYYASLITTRLEDLRISRIEKWQPYDEFMRRRLFPTFKFIGDVGRRIEALRARSDSLIQLIETQQTRRLLDSIKDMTAAQKKTNCWMLVFAALTFFLACIGVWDRIY